MNFTPRHYGYRPDPVDERDHKYPRRLGATRVVESLMDDLVRRIRDQDVSNSCAGHTIVELVELFCAVEGRPVPFLAPAHSYWTGRAVDGFEHEDEGAFLRSVARAALKVGICSEHEWPLIDPETQKRWGAMSYDDKRAYMKVRTSTRPSLVAEMSGIRFADLGYQRVHEGAEHVLDALQDRKPVAFGTGVTSQFVACNSADTIPAPKQGDVIQGMHALLAVGFDRSGARVRVQNHWSRDWGDNGFCWMEAEYFDHPLTQDCWTINVAPGAQKAFP